MDTTAEALSFAQTGSSGWSMEGLLLTILVPTRNRVHRVVPLVGMLIDGLGLRHRSDIEILVLDNCSTDATRVELEKLTGPQVRLFTNEGYLPSSEQNVFSNLHRVRGEYTWFLGDDDLPRIEAVRRLIGHLSSGSADLLISTFRVIDGEGSIGNVSQVRGAPEDVQTDIVSLVKRIGLINFFSGWSVIVARSRLLNVDIARRISDVNPIYAHCFWLLECFKQATTRFLVEPLVDYRIFHQQQGWESYTAERGVGDLYQWGLGLLRLYDHSINQGVLSPRDVSEIYEYRHGGSRYRAVDEIVFKLIEQGDYYLSTSRERNLLTSVELEEAVSILLRIDFSLQDVLSALQRLYYPLRSSLGVYEAVSQYSTARAIVIQLLNRRRDDLCQPFYRQYCYGYLIFEFNTRWVAVHSDGMHHLEHIFAQFLPAAMPPNVLVASTREKIIAEVVEAVKRPEPIGGRPPFTSMSGEDFVSLRAFAAEGDAIIGVPNRVMLLSGWSPPEAHGVWSVGGGAKMVVDGGTGQKICNIKLQPFLPPEGSRRFQVVANGEVVYDGKPANNDPFIVSLGAVRKKGWFVSFVCEPSQSPAEFGHSSDSRRLGLLLLNAGFAESEASPGAAARRSRRWLGLRLSR